MTAEQTQAEAWVWLARIRRVQGRKGEVLADLLTDFPEKFAERKRVWLIQEKAASVEPREIEVKAHWLPKGGHSGDVVLHFGGVDSIEAAEKLRSLIVAIPRTERAPLGEDEVYIGDMIGCTLIDVATDPETTVGQIEGADRDAGPVVLLVIKGNDSDEILVPFAKAYLRKIDLEAQRVEMALPEGLIEAQLN